VRRTSVPFALILLAASAVGAASAQARPVVHVNHEARDHVVRYWTPDRMRHAVPADRYAKPAPTAKPGSGGGTTSATSFEAPLPYPSAHGKVFFTDNSGVNYVCSGTALVSTNQSVVWTAGHCVNEGPGNFYKNFLFVPAYRNGDAPYGKFAGPTLLTTSGWQANGQYGVDEGAAVVGKNAAGQTLDQAVAERPIVFNAVRNESYKLYGYPAARRFSGQLMEECDTAWSLDDASATPADMGVPCDMTGGSSGGGWVTSSGAVASVVSYYYPSLKNVLFGPHQETEAQQLYSTAESR
jgi:V8-like Glu-specific endopeptidase